jgi:CheY-like chemotaxis protein
MILFIDDEPLSIEPYTHAVAAKGFEVKLLTSLGEVEDFLAIVHDGLRCIVLDVMFPVDKSLPGILISDGLTAGMPLFASLRAQYPLVPVVVLTNSMSVAVKSFFRNQQKCAFYYKTELLPDELARVVADLVEDKGSQLIERLQLCLPGRGMAAKFEALSIEILEFLFVPPFKRVVPQVRRAGGHDIRDAILPNNAANYFWSSLRSELDARHIVVEFKNYTKPVGKAEVLQLKEYLARKSLGRFGLLVSRLPPSGPALVAQANAYGDQDCLILFLHDGDIEKMIEARRQGGDPSIFLEQMKEEFEWTY